VWFRAGLILGSGSLLFEALRNLAQKMPVLPTPRWMEPEFTGGDQGWFHFDLLWRIRGLMDKLAGGFGDSVGRRTEANLRVGDILDVWKVIDLQENRRLLLEAHMKVAGKAWLEFRIEGDTLVQTATHYPKGLLGRLYWYSMLPFHAFIFPDMIRSIIRQAGRMA
jgi:Protein of unknown function (DUF2867)